MRRKAGVEAPADFGREGFFDGGVEEGPDASGFGFDGDADGAAGSVAEGAAGFGGVEEVLEGQSGVGSGVGPVGEPAAGDGGEGSGCAFGHEGCEDAGAAGGVVEALGGAPVGAVGGGLDVGGMEVAVGKGVDHADEEVVDSEEVAE